METVFKTQGYVTSGWGTATHLQNNTVLMTLKRGRAVRAWRRGQKFPGTLALKTKAIHYDKQRKTGCDLQSDSILFYKIL